MSVNEIVRKTWNSLIRNKKTSKKVKRVSYSQLNNWLTCPHLHWLISIAKELPYENNIHTAYGNPVHDTLQLMLMEDALREEPSDYISFFKRKYVKELKKLIDLEIDVDVEILENQTKAFQEMIPQVIPIMREKFGNFKLIEAERDIYMDIDIETDEFIFVMSGYIDVIIETEDGKTHIIDWKTCTKTWNKYKRKEEKYLAQMLLYKYCYNKSFPQINMDDIEIHYIFLPTNDKELEVFTVEHSQDDVDGAVKRLNQMILNAYKIKQYPKNPTCNFCDCKKYYDNK